MGVPIRPFGISRRIMAPLNSMKLLADSIKQHCNLPSPLDLFSIVRADVPFGLKSGHPPLRIGHLVPCALLMAQGIGRGAAWFHDWYFRPF